MPVAAAALAWDPVAMNPEDTLPPDVTFRPVTAYPALTAWPDRATLYALTSANSVATEPRRPTVIHMYDSG